MKPATVLFAPLLICPALAHAQLVKKYVSQPQILVQAGPLTGPRRNLNGYLRAGDSVEVDQTRSLPYTANPASEQVYKWYVWVWYPAYPQLQAGGGWVARKFLVSQRDSVRKF